MGNAGLGAAANLQLVGPGDDVVGVGDRIGVKPWLFLPCAGHHLAALGEADDDVVDVNAFE